MTNTDNDGLVLVRDSGPVVRACELPPIRFSPEDVARWEREERAAPSRKVAK